MHKKELVKFNEQFNFLPITNHEDNSILKKWKTDLNLSYIGKDNKKKTKPTSVKSMGPISRSSSLDINQNDPLSLG